MAPTIGIVKIVYNQRKICSSIRINIEDNSIPGVTFYIQDDCSSDGTYEELSSRPVPNKIVTQTHRNLGPRGNVADLLDKTSEDYLNFSAGDDFVCASSLRQLQEKLSGDNYDLVISRVVRAPLEIALEVAQDPYLQSNSAEEMVGQTAVTERDWQSSQQMLETAAVIPGLIWTQGILVKSDVAKQAGYMSGGSVDDWGLLHNLALLSRRREIKVLYDKSILGVLGRRSDSLGMNVEKQLRDQVAAVEKYWHPDLKKTALHNLIRKKLDLMMTSDISASQYLEVLRRGLS